MTTKIKTDLLKLGWYQIIGGIIGVLIILYSLLGLTQLSGLVIFIYVFMLLFYAFSIYCGILCIKHKNNALKHSLVNQLLQLLSFAVLGFAFAYVAGLHVSVGLDLSTSIEMKFNFGISNFDFNINRELERTEINFNLVAFGLIYWIDKLMKKLKEEKTNIEIASVGQ
jgi:hypothetical protein